MKIILTAIILTMFTFSLNAQDKVLKNKEHAYKLSLKVAELLKDNKASNAIEELKPYWRTPQNEIDLIEEKSNKYVKMINGMFGESIGVSKVKEEKIEEIALRETYLIRYKNHALRMVLTYYKNNEGWIVHGFLIDFKLF